MIQLQNADVVVSNWYFTNRACADKFYHEQLLGITEFGTWTCLEYTTYRLNGKLIYCIAFSTNKEYK